MNKPFGLHWFRRDLRVAGNPALQTNWKINQGRVVGLFVFDRTFLSRPDFSANRFAFFLETLKELRSDLRALGSDLLVLDVAPLDAFPRLWKALSARECGLPSLVTWNKDYEPFARQRDIAMERWFESQGTAWQSERDHLLIEPSEIFKGKTPLETYQVFTPFSRRWYEGFAMNEVKARVAQQKKGIEFLDRQKKGAADPIFNLSWSSLLKTNDFDKATLETYLAKTRPLVSVKLPAAGSQAALQRLRDFSAKIDEYELQRDIPAVRGTSGISPYLKNGSLTIAQAIAELDLRPDKKGQKSGRGKFFNELVWREFYYHILFHHPRVETSPFVERYSSLQWDNRPDWFLAWKEGMTGFPIIDAGMRQLNTTGWMHNRVRMIVASFLTKDLHIDYRWGERYFMEKLIDGDLAPNNGGWQWAASTGCDPQPYFRIFNPVLQSQRFDPSGDYLRKYVPELRHLNGKAIHDPDALERRNYPQPIVVHAEERDIALERYSR